MRIAKLISLALLLVAFVLRPAAARAIEFRPPSVKVFVSSAAPAGHPDLQARIEIATGELFDQVDVLGPPGGSVASAADLGDDLIIGRLDGEATTNALTRPTCDQHVAFSVPIRTATANPESPAYPAFLKTIAPGSHRLRLIADVSPSPQVPVVINYLFDIDPTSNGVRLRVFIGDPNHPASQLKTCAPSKSTNTLFGVTPLHTPLLTASADVTDPRFPFSFKFTSRPDAAGTRRTQSVSVLAEVRPADVAPLPTSAPVQSVPHGDGPPAPTLVPGTGAPGAAQAAMGIRPPSTGDGPGTRQSWDEMPVAVGLLGFALAVVGATTALAKRQRRHRS